MFFRILLWFLGVVMALASRLSSRFRAQIGRDITIELRSQDGVARQFLFRNRTVSSRAGSPCNADCVLCFDTAWFGFRTLFSPRAVENLFQGMVDERIRVTGRGTVLPWFGFLVLSLIPFGPRARLQRTPPHAYTKPNSSADVERRIVREPAVDDLDPTWKNAHVQTKKLPLRRAYDREPPPMF
jgi:hypothetical protein